MRLRLEVERGFGAMSASGEVSVKVYAHENPTRKSQCTTTCVIREGGTFWEESFETLTDGFRRGFRVPGSSNRVPEPGGPRVSNFHGGSGCVLDDWGRRLRV